MNVKDLNAKRKDTVERPYEGIGNRIREWRMSSNISQKDLIESGAPVKITTLRLMEGGVRAPSAELLIFLRKTYRLDLNYVLMGKE